ncbi:PAS domain S-box-containing protein/diguanylate cyclase (GGDEF) domain-containing protein [Franzmannia pantelleriensis]|uniref:diguanylate cyclase n=1 Tax=Franzmannia pantelleriensis TaxID=48727 RepID=A0A1G9RFD9_9GAMM|nr:sensor domain-containing diguanylate cyclase [Halomonas pantelleriensis]SDM21956.1 PAS domain S-box-containing protein/diguanylate cyclase (GGDEF) domain-containing protein [Halomonas pantelleriensis]
MVDPQREQQREQAWLERLTRSQRNTQRVIEAAPVGICITDPDGRFEMVNPTYCEFYGYDQEELLGESFTMVVPTANQHYMDELHRRFIRGDETRELRGEWEVKRKDGEVRTILADAVRIHGDDGRPRKVTFVVDITARKQLERDLEEMNQRLTYLATHDELTGLLNRRAGLDRLSEEMHRSNRYGVELCIALFDLDHFKQVNDRHGHAVGDEVLRQLAALVKHQLRESDLVIRLGGEEFLAVMPSVDTAGAEQAMQRVRHTLANAPLTDERLSITLSAGVVGYHEQTATQLLEQADKALYRAKHAGRNCIVSVASPS